MKPLYLNKFEALEAYLKDLDPEILNDFYDEVRRTECGMYYLEYQEE